MKKALVEPSGRVAEVRAQEFPVAAPLVWRDCADDVKPETHRWDGAGFMLLPPAPAPFNPDLSDLDNLQKTLKALALCVAQVGGLTPAQMKVMFKQKWDSLP